jgi:hypothetical protein
MSTVKEAFSNHQADMLYVYLVDLKGPLPGPLFVKVICLISLSIKQVLPSLMAAVL